MKITNIETFIVDAGWRPWIFVKVESDNGLIGYGECSEARTPNGVVGTIRDMSDILIGTDPNAYEMRFWDMARKNIQGPGGIAGKAMAGIENAIIDLKAKSLDISVVELFGCPTRNETRLYWSHCGTTRALNHELLNTNPIKSLSDISDLGKEVVAKGYTALKTNIILPGDPAQTYFPGFASGPGTTDQNVTNELLSHIVDLIETFRNSVGPNVDINLDLNFNFKPEAVMRIAKALEPLNLLWLETDIYNPDALKQIKESTNTKICTGENLFYMREYLPYFSKYCADVFMIDIPWNGIVQSKKIGYLAQVHEMNIAPHNYYSHLSTFISASLCAVLPNVRIMEIDVDDVPWKDELVTVQPDIESGYMKTPSGPGWGTELNEKVAKKYAWTGNKANW